ncbi:MAG: MarR family transcriptional regulator [Candidatus Diapherotrites archaeon]|nr:MarR family transcriptional regulator [Candidatus Diapherotrites archaeon]
MKPLETFLHSDKKYVAIMVLCFLYGGYSIISFALQSYTLIWRTEIIGFPFEGRFDDGSRKPFDANQLRANDTNESSAAIGQQPRDPLAGLLSPVSLSWLFGGLISILAGLSIWNLIRKREIKKIKQETANNLLLPDERKVIDALKKSDFEMAQAKLARETGLSKVQVHRAVKRLEAKGVLEKHSYGLTNKIILKKELFD